MHWLLPALSDNDYELLKADIAQRGVQVPVEYDELGEILDGHHRVRSCQDLGIKDWPKIIRSGMTKEEKVEHALSLNMNRRHLTRKQRKELVVNLRAQGWSLRRIAERVGVSDFTVRQDITASGAINHAPATVTGADGKQYPAAQTAPSNETPPPNDILPSNIAPPSGETLSSDETPPPHESPIPIETFPLHENEPPQHIPISDESTDETKKPHVSHNSGNNEWYTPQEYTDAARTAMGEIDLDPASSNIANKTVKAKLYYTIEDDGLKQPWGGRVWLNPPYSQPQVALFADRITSAFKTGEIQQACILVNNATETQWFQSILSVASAVCFIRGRIRFLDQDGNPSGAPLQGQAILYLGEKTSEFANSFSRFGPVFQPIYQPAHQKAGV